VSKFLEPKSCNPYIEKKKHTIGTASLTTNGARMPKIEGLSENFSY